MADITVDHIPAAIAIPDTEENVLVFPFNLSAPSMELVCKADPDNGGTIRLNALGLAAESDYVLSPTDESPTVVTVWTRLSVKASNSNDVILLSR